MAFYPPTMDSEMKLHSAILRRSWSEASRLAAAGIGIEFIDTNGRSILYVAVANNAPIDLIRTLFRKGVKVNDKGRSFDQQTCLHSAFQRNIATALFEFLVDNGGKVNQSDRFKRTPLHCANFGTLSPSLFNAALAKGADLNREDINGWTPLMHAIEQRAVKFIPILLRCGGDPMHKARDGKDCSMIAHEQDLPYLASVLQCTQALVILSSARSVPRICRTNTGARRMPADLLRTMRSFFVGS